MSKLKRGYQTFSPFPKTGLVKDHEGKIREHVGWFCKKFPNLRREEVLIEAVRLASRAEQLHDPKKGAFWTLCEYRLRELNRFAEREFNSWRIPLSKVLDKDEIERRETEERRNGIGGDEPRQINFSGMGNGTRLTWDLQWFNATPASSITVTFGEAPAIVNRHRVRIGTQLRSGEESYARGVMERASPDVKTVLEGREPSPITRGYVRAVADHNERREREAQQEAENRRFGDYDAVILPTSEQKFDIAFYKGRNPPKFSPDYIQIVSLSETVTHDDGHVSTLADTIAGPEPVSDSREGIKQQLKDAIAAERPHLSEREAGVLDQRTLAGRPIMQVALDLGMTKGGISKVEDRVIERLTRRLNEK